MKTTLLLCVVCAAIAVSESITCGNDTCADDEECNNGDTACQCNTTLYTNTESNPAPNVTCDGEYFNVQVSKCWLEKNSYNTSSVRLNSTDAICMATRDITTGTALMTIHQPVTTADCNTQKDANTTHVTYRNLLHISANTLPNQTRNDSVTILSCTYSVPFGIEVINVPDSFSSYTANMVAYKDSEFLNPLTDSDTLYVEDFIYIAVSILDLDSNTVKLKLVKISAFPDNSNSTGYTILEDGCPSPDLPVDQISVNENGVSNEARFRMKAFQISGSYTVRLFADLVLCLYNCTQDCNSQTRSVTFGKSAGSVSILLESTSRYYDTSSASGFSVSWTLPVLIFSCILVKLM